MNVELGTEATQCPEKEYTKGIFLAVYLIRYFWGALGSAGLEEEWRRRTVPDWNSSRAHPGHGDETKDGGYQVRATTTQNNDDNQRSPEGQRRTI